MGLIIGLVFLGVFGVVVLIAAASGTGATEQTRAIMTRLESAIAVGKPEMADLIVDVRKNELMSSIPWLDRYLSKLELAPRIRRFLYQANVKWTVGGLSLFCAVCFIVPAYLIYLRTGSVILGIIIGLVAWSGTVRLGLPEAENADEQIRGGNPRGPRTDCKRPPCGAQFECCNGSCLTRVFRSRGGRVSCDF